LQDYEIKVGDILKIGRVKFAVKEINLKSHVSGQQMMKTDDQEYKDLKNVITDSKEIEEMDCPEEDKPRCRFDWGSEATEENPLVVPCQCQGSIGYIHLNCLKQWMRT